LTDGEIEALETRMDTVLSIAPKDALATINFSADGFKCTAVFSVKELRKIMSGYQAYKDLCI